MGVGIGDEEAVAVGQPMQRAPDLTREAIAPSAAAMQREDERAGAGGRAGGA